MNTRHLRAEDLAGKRWRGYVRESSQEQADRGTPVDRQRRELDRAAADLGLVAAEPRWYERVGSGEVEGASELARALEDGKAHEFDVLLVFHTSRFARNRTEATSLKRDFRRAGIVIYFVAQRLISGAFTGTVTEGIHEVLDEYENETRRLWVAGGLRERQAAGRWVGRIPFGYRKRFADQPDGSRAWEGALDEDPLAAPLIRRMFDDYLAGTPARTIAGALNLAGHRTTGGGPWGMKAVRAILTNPVYLGRLVRYRRPRSGHYYPEDDAQDGHLELEGTWPAIVDEAVWAAVQTVDPPRLRRPARPYPLSTLLRCGECGWTMTGFVDGTGKRRYRCSLRWRSGECLGPSVLADRVEGQFADWLASYVLPPDWRREITRLTLGSHRADESRRRATIEAQLTRLRNLYVWDELDEESFREQTAALRADLALTVKPAMASLRELAESLERLGPAWRSGSAQQQAATARMILASATVREGSIREFVVRADLRPVLELARVVGADSPWVEGVDYTVRFTA